MILTPTFLFRIEKIDKMLEANRARFEYETGLLKAELDNLRHQAEQAYAAAKKAAGDS